MQAIRIGRDVYIVLFTTRGSASVSAWHPDGKRKGQAERVALDALI